MSREPQEGPRSRIPRRAAGQRLLDHLCERFRYLDRDGWLAELHAGRVQLDGRAARADHVLRAGAELQWQRARPEPYADTQVTVLHEDAAIVVVDKPAHLAMHADGPFVHETLVQVLRRRLRAPDLQLVHRLDRETSGVCVVARDDAARAHLQRQFAEHAVEKTYHAIVRGEVREPFVADEPIGRATASCIALRRAAGTAAEAPQPAHTRITPEDRGPAATRVRCEPTTGRTHQIRVHLEAHGHAILGDKLYGRPDGDYLAFVQRVKRDGDARAVPAGEPDRQLLHASELRFRHPLDERPCHFMAPLPAAFARWLVVWRPPGA